jgi:micrococcal nuclease
MTHKRIWLSCNHAPKVLRPMPYRAAICILIVLASGMSTVARATDSVTRVVDVDTIDVQLTSGPIRVRLYGIDAPESTQPGGAEATSFLAKKILHQKIDLEPFQQDRYNRMIALVNIGNENINKGLVRQGHAWAFRKYLHRSDIDYCKDEAEARTAKRGVWSLPRIQQIAPWEYRKRKSRNSFTDYSAESVVHCIAELGKR